MITQTVLTKKIRQFNKSPHFGPKKCPVYLYLLWLKNVLIRFKTQLKIGVKCCFFAIKPQFVFTTRQLLSSTIKNKLPASHYSNVVYLFLCHCDSCYILKGCNKRSNNIFSNLSCKDTFHMSTAINLTPANPTTVKLKPHSEQQNNTFCKACVVHINND